MGQIALNLPIAGQPNTTEDAKVIADFTLVQNVINGNLDSNNIAASLGQAAGVNVPGQTVKGVANIPTTESRTNVAYGTLATPDQVTGIVLPTDGLVTVWYHATWQESVGNGARAAIFVGANQLKIAFANNNTAPQTASSEASINSGFTTDSLLTTRSIGLVGVGGGSFAGAYTGDVTTGQIVGSQTDASPVQFFAAAGTYTISVQFKASAGTVTVKNRRLWVLAQSFA